MSRQSPMRLSVYALFLSLSLSPTLSLADPATTAPTSPFAGVGGVLKGFLERHGLGATGSAGEAAEAGAALSLATRRGILGVVAGAGVFEAISLYGFGKTMEACIEAALQSSSSGEYQDQVDHIKQGLRKHWLTGGTIVGNEIAGNIRKRPDETAQACQLMSDVGVTAAPAVAAQMGCKGGSITRIPSRNMLPPGNCTPQDYKKLKDNKDKMCGIKRACKGGMDRDDLLANISNINNCIDAREDVMNRCFMGGNDTHHNALQDEKRALATCNDLLGSSP